MHLMLSLHRSWKPAVCMHVTMHACIHYVRAYCHVIWTVFLGWGQPITQPLCTWSSCAAEWSASCEPWFAWLHTSSSVTEDTPDGITSESIAKRSASSRWCWWAARLRVMATQHMDISELVNTMLAVIMARLLHFAKCDGRLSMGHMTWRIHCCFPHWQLAQTS